MTFEPLKQLDSGGGSTLGDYKFLYGFVSLIKPSRIFEIGTNYGVSAIAMAMALRDEGMIHSKIVSVDVNPAALEIARKQLNQLSLVKYVELVHGDSSIISRYQPFDMVFIDGDHAYEWCLKDFDNVKDRATYILMHDSQSLKGVTKATKTIADTNEYDIINLDVREWGEQWTLGAVVCRAYTGFSIIRRKNNDR